MCIVFIYIELCNTTLYRKYQLLSMVTLFFFYIYPSVYSWHGEMPPDAAVPLSRQGHSLYQYSVSLRWGSGLPWRLWRTCRPMHRRWVIDSRETSSRNEVLLSKLNALQRNILAAITNTFLQGKAYLCAMSMINSTEMCDKMMSFSQKRTFKLLDSHKCFSLICDLI